MDVVGADCSRRLGDIWYALDTLWRTAQLMHLVAATLDAMWQVSYMYDYDTQYLA